jgi:mono/diheme cytochrome c family protein
MKVKRWLAALVIPAVLGIALITGPTPAVNAADAGATYKAKCTACHGAKAEKAFNPSKADDALVGAVMNGVKPKMPAYGKSLTGDDAKALVAYMRQLRK